MLRLLNLLVLSVVLVLSPLVWVFAFENKRFKTKKRFLKEFSLFSDDLKQDLAVGFTGFLVLLLVVFLFGEIITVFFQNDSDLVVDVVKSLDFSYLVLVFILQVPIEEFFFRGFLVKRFGVWLPALLFGLAHLAYGSVIEVILAIVAGVVLGFIFLKRENIIAPVVSHALLNLTTLLMIALGV